MSRSINALVMAALLGASGVATAADQHMTVDVKRLSMESALKIAQAAVLACREKGIQAGVTVMDRGGNPQVVLRDSLAADLTLTISKQKAYTALSFMTPTSKLSDRADPGGLANVPGLLFRAGGLPIEVGGVTYGSVGVSGAPSGETDEECAQAGINAVKMDLEMR